MQLAVCQEVEEGSEGAEPRRATDVFERDDVGVLPVAQQDLHLLRRVPLGLADDLRGEEGAQ